MADPKKRFLGGARILPQRVRGEMTAAQLVEEVFSAYNAARLREGARLLASKMLEADVTVAASLTGALTPGARHLVPDPAASRRGSWTGSSRPARTCTTTRTSASACRCTTGHRSTSTTSSCASEGRDPHLRHLLRLPACCSTPTRSSARSSQAPEFQRPMSTAEFHYLCGKYVARARAGARARGAARCSPRPASAACRSTPRRPATPRSA